ncbi:hypothetical protein [Actinomadura sp. NPDC049753]|uniref:hypothetical protein n=1 Tax=Actinomadura sp. NPDC049753 TaxID=3154739 RepID=UPI003426277E
MEGISALHKQFVEWVYDHSNATPLGDVDVREFGKPHGLSGEGCWTLLRQCKERGFVEDEHSTYGTPAANLTPYGREWAEARKSRRGDKIQRKIAARNGLLVRLHGRCELHGYVEGRNSPASLTKASPTASSAAPCGTNRSAHGAGSPTSIRASWMSWGRRSVSGWPG